MLSASLGLTSGSDQEWLANFVELISIATGLNITFNDHIDLLHPATKLITTDVRFTANWFLQMKDLWCDGKDTRVFPFKETRMLLDMPPNPPHAINVVTKDMLQIKMPGKKRKGKKREKVMVDKTVIGRMLCKELEGVIQELAVKQVYGEDQFGMMDLRQIPKDARLSDYFDMLRVVQTKDLYRELKEFPAFVDAEPKKEYVERIKELKREAEVRAKQKEAEAKAKKSSGPRGRGKRGSPKAKKEPAAERGSPIPEEIMMELMDWYLEKTKLE